MKKNLLFIIILILVLVVIATGIAVLSKDGRSKNSPENSKEQMVGNDKDEYGCIVSAGYSWCNLKNKCLRSWEEACDEQLDLSLKEMFAEKYKRELKDIKVTVGMTDGQYVRGGVNMTQDGVMGEGANFLAVKSGEKWQLVFDGNGEIACQLVEKYNFPAIMVDDCAR